MQKPSDYFKKLDLAHLDANTAQFIREKILTLPNVDILENTKEFETIKAIVEESFPRAIGIEPVVTELIIEVVPEPIIEEVIEEIVEPIIDTKQEEIKTISGQVSEMTDLIDLLSELVAENPSDLDSLDVLELYKENLVELADKLKSLTEVITEAVIEVKDNIEEVKEVIKTDVVDNKGILTAPKQYKTEDGLSVLGYESDWNFGLKKHLGETVVYYVSNEDDKNKYSVLSGILHKGEIVYSEDKTSNKEFENYSENVDDALKLAYELANDKEAIDKYSLGGAIATGLIGAAVGAAVTYSATKKSWKDDIINSINEKGYDKALNEDLNIDDDEFNELRDSYIESYNTLSNYTDKSINTHLKPEIDKQILKQKNDGVKNIVTNTELTWKSAKAKKIVGNYLEKRAELSEYIGYTEKFEKGGEIKNNYVGKTGEEVWDGWNTKQRSHFLADHFSNEDGATRYGKTFDADEIINFGLGYKDLPKVVQNEIRNHISEGQYEKGGKVDENIAKIRFNDHWKKVQLYIDGSLYGEFDTYQDAIKEAEGNRSKVIVEDDVTMLNISSEKPLSNQLSKITGDGWNDIDYENLDGSKSVTTSKPFKHVKTGKIFEVYKK